MCNTKDFFLCPLKVAFPISSFYVRGGTLQTCSFVFKSISHITCNNLNLYFFRVANATANSSLYQCCSGLCIDLLKILAEKMGFQFDLFQVEDKKFGAFDKVNIEKAAIIT